MHAYPQRVVVEVTTVCHLACPSCVKHTHGWQELDGHMDPAVFQALQPVLAQAQRVILSGIGEPLLHPDLVAWIALVRQWNPRARIGFQSGGMLLTSAVAEALVDAGLNQICFSVDAADALLEKLRPGAHLEGVARAFAAMHNAAQKAHCEVDIGVEIVLSRANLAMLPRVVQWCAQHGARFLLLTHLIPYRPQDAATTLYTFLSQRTLDFVRRAKADWQAQGLDMHRVDQAYYNPFPTPKDRHIVAALRQLLLDARQAGVELPLGRMLHAVAPEAEAMRRCLEDALAAAQAVAQYYGVRLEVPQAAGADPGTCPFVREPTFAVARDGLLAPCPFLWHSMDIFPEGHQIRIRQLALGRVPEDDPLAVWHSPRAQRFRHEAQGGFARCWDCNVVPCNYVEGITEPFISDCYGSIVPCGVCPWSGGGFRCLD